MRSYTTILNGSELTQVLNLPQEFVDAQVEVKVRVLKKLPVSKKSKFDDFFGVTNIDSIDQEIKNIRDDWK